MRVLVTCPEMVAMGGAERFALRMVTGLVERGHTVGLVAGPGDLDPALAGVDHRRFPLPPPTRSPRKLVATLNAMRSAVSRFRPDVIHAQNVTHAALGALAVRLVPGSRARILTTFHGVEPGEYRLAARLFRSADVVACVSGDLLDSLVEAGFPPGRAFLVHNGIATPEPLSTDRLDELDADLGMGPTVDGRRTRLVAAVGRLESQKAHDTFLGMAARVAARLPGTRFAIVGDGSLRAELQQQARDLGIDDVVVFTLYRKDARDIIARSDLLVFSSRWEGLSIAALEALASGTPVVSTPSQGMRVLLECGAGEIVDGSAESLSNSVEALLRDDERRTAMGAEGRRLTAGPFSDAEMLDTYVRLYEELVPRPRSAVR